MVDVSSSWVCQTEGHCLSDVLLSVNINDDEELSEKHDPNRGAVPVLLQQTEEGSPCVLSLSCRPSEPPAAVRRLLLVTEARTVEVYDQTGEYCGTVRGERDQTVHSDSSDSGPFYRKQLVLSHPSTSCEVKLLSLSGRRCVQVQCLVVGLQTLRSGPGLGSGIDMQQVQTMVEEMGTRLSPGAQHLMDMVQFQQQNETSSLSSLFPMLMGGRGLSLNQPLTLTPQTSAPAPETPPTQNGGVSHDSGPSSTDSSNTESGEVRGPVSPAQITEMMSQLMKRRGLTLSSAPDLLPVLQSVCGHVTQLRLDNASAVKQLSNGSCELEPAMERRLEEMERRLKEHFDRRLDALEQKLETALTLALTQNCSGLTTKGPTEERRSETTINTN